MDFVGATKDANGNGVVSAKSAAASEAHLNREAARVKAGHLTYLARLVLFTPELPDGETNHFSVVALNDIQFVPSGIAADVKLSDLDRCQLRVFKYTNGRTPDCKSCVFARVEENIPEDDVWTDLNGALLKMAKLVQIGTSIERAYKMVVGRHRDAIFRKYEYTEKGQKQNLRYLERPKEDPIAVSATTSAGEADGEDSAESGEEVEADGDSMSMATKKFYKKPEQAKAVLPRRSPRKNPSKEKASPRKAVTTRRSKGKDKAPPEGDQGSAQGGAGGADGAGGAGAPAGGAGGSGAGGGGKDDEDDKKGGRRGGKAKSKTDRQTEEEKEAAARKKAQEEEDAARKKAEDDAMVGTTPPRDIDQDDDVVDPDYDPVQEVEEVVAEEEEEVDEEEEEEEPNISSLIQQSSLASGAGALSSSQAGGSSPSPMMPPPPPPPPPAAGGTPPAASTSVPSTSTSGGTSAKTKPGAAARATGMPTAAMKRKAAAQAKKDAAAAAQAAAAACSGLGITASSVPTPRKKRKDAADVPEAYKCDPAKCICETLNPIDIKTQNTSEENHRMMVFIEKTIKSVRDQANYALKEAQANSVKLDELLKIAKEGTSYAQSAAEQKTMEKLQEEDASTLVLPWMNNSEVNFAMSDPPLYHAVRRYLTCVKAANKFWLMKAATELFGPHLLGRFYLQWPVGFPDNLPLARAGEQYYILNKRMQTLFTNQLIKLGFRKSMVADKLDTFFSQRRTDQQRMALATLFRRECHDEVARLVLLHETYQMGILELDAPFRGTDLADRKAAWLHEHKQQILDKYNQLTNGAPLPPVRSEADAEAAAQNNITRIKHKNYPDRLE